MRRRTFMVSVGAAALSWPAIAQQQRVHKIGVLMPSRGAQRNLDLLKAALRDLGRIEGKSVEFVVMSAEGDLNKLTELAQELVRQKPDVLVVFFTPSARAAKAATTQIPIVLAPTADPVATGLVSNFARPGGNVTGMSATAREAIVKTVELLREVMPSARRMAAVITPDDPLQVRAAGRAVAIELHPIMVRNVDELPAAFTSMARERTDAVLVQTDLGARGVELALKNRIPPIGVNPALAELGCLLTYSGDMADIARRSATFVDRILKGAKPGDLPIEQPTKFELVISQKTARQLNINVPQSVLLRADRVIA